MKRLALSLSIVSLLVLGGCSKPADPGATARAFWDAIIARDVEAARALALPGSMDQVNFDDQTKDDARIEIGAVSETEDGRAQVDTTLISMTGAGEQMSIPFQTQLQYTPKGWRVDMTQTQLSMMGGVFNSAFQELGKSFGDAMKGITDKLDEGMKRFTEEMEKAQREAEEREEKAPQSY